MQQNKGKGGACGGLGVGGGGGGARGGRTRPPLLFACLGAAWLLVWAGCENVIMEKYINAIM